MDYFFEKIIIFIGIVLVIIFITLLALIPFAIYGLIDASNKEKECFMQEVKTKECEYILWQAENNRCKPKTNVMPVPMLMHR